MASVWKKKKPDDSLLSGLQKDVEQMKKWISQRMGKDIKVESKEVAPSEKRALGTSGVKNITTAMHAGFVTPRAVDMKALKVELTPPSSPDYVKVSEGSPKEESKVSKPGKSGKSKPISYSAAVSGGKSNSK